MNELQEKADGINNDRALVAEEANYQSVQEQIKVGEQSINEALDAIKQYQDHIRLTRADVRRLKARKKVFARAKFQLEQINEEFGE